MRTIARTMLAAAAGAALVASGITVVRLSDPAFAEGRHVAELGPAPGWSRRQWPGTRRPHPNP